MNEPTPNLIQCPKCLRLVERTELQRIEYKPSWFDFLTRSKHIGSQCKACVAKHNTELPA